MTRALLDFTESTTTPVYGRTLAERLADERDVLRAFVKKACFDDGRSDDDRWKYNFWFVY